MIASYLIEVEISASSKRNKDDAATRVCRRNLTFRGSEAPTAAASAVGPAIALASRLAAPAAARPAPTPGSPCLGTLGIRRRETGRCPCNVRRVRGVFRSSAPAVPETLNGDVANLFATARTLAVILTYRNLTGFSLRLVLHPAVSQGRNRVSDIVCWTGHGTN